jgi:hypothetical protein
MEEIKLWLDTYDDLYSDFDSRHYLKRRISQDLMVELRWAIPRDSNYPKAIVFILPANQRDQENEKHIVENMSRFFKAERNRSAGLYKRKLLIGLILLFLGFTIMAITTFMIYQSGQSVIQVGLKVILEPAGWFLVWAGMDYLFYDLRELTRDKNFYGMLAALHIEFRTDDEKDNHLK